MNTAETPFSGLFSPSHARACDESAAVARFQTTYDSIICFGGVDWWYHNRGHYDLQMMRELSSIVPVLYINSIGMRFSAPGQHSQLARRISRKLRSVLRGRVRVKAGMSVYSPFAPPVRFGRTLVNRTLAFQVRAAARALGFRHPLVWVACPSAVDVIESLDAVSVVYQRTDRYEEYPGANRERVEAQDLTLKALADVTLFCSSTVMDEERAQCRRALFADHGVDFSHFARAGDARASLPEIADIPSPRIGYVGNLEPHRVDHRLLEHIARTLPEMHLVIVGPGTLSPALTALPNVHRFPQQPYERVARFTSACDVLIMPWCDNAWIRACNPIKLKEYLAVGRPVVSTAFDELRRYEGYVRVARSYDAFVDAIRHAVREGDAPQRLRARVEQETWSAKAHLVIDMLRDACGFHAAA